jgi:CBS domain-containing protein
MRTVNDILMGKGPDVLVAPPEASVRDAARLMAQGNVGAVIVRDDGGVAGIFTERDLLRRIVAPGRDPDGTTLRDAMTSPVKTCRLADTLVSCGRRLTEGHFRHLAVVEDGALVGVVSLRDVLTAAAADGDAASERLLRAAQPE